MPTMVQRQVAFHPFNHGLIATALMTEWLRPGRKSLSMGGPQCGLGAIAASDWLHKKPGFPLEWPVRIKLPGRFSKAHLQIAGGHFLSEGITEYIGHGSLPSSRRGVIVRRPGHRYQSWFWKSRQQVFLDILVNVIDITHPVLDF